jgi:light-harvesting complex I chlorophyll a/b binding protein 1
MTNELIKIGRVAMLAVVGILVGEAVEFSSLFGNKVTGPALYQFQEADQLTGFGFAFAIVGLISIIEGLGVQRNWADGKVRGDIIPGDLNWDPLGLRPTEPEAFAALQTKEINNGINLLLLLYIYVTTTTINTIITITTTTTTNNNNITIFYYHYY